MELGGFLEVEIWGLEFGFSGLQNSNFWGQFRVFGVGFGIFEDGFGVLDEIWAFFGSDLGFFGSELAFLG